MLRMCYTLVGSGLFWRALGMAGLCLLIAYVGPLVSIGVYRPLAPVAARQGAIGVVLALWLLQQLLPGIRQARLQRHLRRQLHESAAAPSADRPDDTTLTEDFTRALRTLKRYHGGGAGGVKSWLAGLGRQYVYATPWYLVLGAGGSGKSKALQSAGLELLHPVHRPGGEARANRPAGHCEWYFTPQGVLLCPSSGFLVEGSPLWRMLLGLLKRHRARQPINGVVLAISAQELLHDTRDVQYNRALQLRKRLLTLRRRLGITLPIYVMITKVDDLPGFSHFFSQFDDAGLEQSWGMAFPWQDYAGQGFQQQAVFDRAYDRLLCRINAALGDTLLGEQDARARARSFVFPQAFAALRPVLLRYLRLIFTSTAYDPALCLRGVYFTSANQQTARHAAATPVGKENVFDFRFTPADCAIDADAGSSLRQSYFLKCLFRDIIFAESGLAGTRYWGMCRRRLMFIAGCGALAVLLFLSGGYCIASFQHNRDYLSETQARVAGLERLSAALIGDPNPNLQRMLPFFDALEGLAASDRFDWRHPPLDYRMGLYQGTLLASAADVVYQHALKRIVLPLVVQQATAALSRPDASEADDTYQALKAYVMLHEPLHYDGEFLRAWVIATLARMPGAAELDNAGRARLYNHLSRLITHRPLRAPDAQNPLLVESARRAVQRKTLSQRVYQRLKHALINDERFKPVSLVDLAGAAAEQELVRVSGIAVTAPVAGLFTPAGYWLGFQPRLAATIAGVLAEDQWVLNQPAPIALDDLADNVTHWYMNDFILHWDSFLNDIGLMQTLDRNQRINRVRVLSGDRSPLRQLVIGIGDILSLLPPENARGKLPELTRRIGERATGVLADWLDPDPATAVIAPEQLVRNHYRDFIDLARAQNEHGDRIVFDAILQRLDGLYRYLLTLQNGEDTPPGEVLIALRADAQRLPPPLRNLVLALADSANHDGQRQAWLHLRRLFDSDIGDYCHLVINGRYPLARSSAIDLSPDDLARMFAPRQGIADRFFQRHLTDKVITDDSQWRFLPWVDPGQHAGDDGMLHFFHAARDVANAYFRPGSLRPSFSFTLRPLGMDNGILSLSLDIDGQTLSYNHGQTVDYRLTWPGPRQTGKARLTMLLANGAVKTIEKQGAWAFNRLLDSGKNQRGADDQVRRITFTLGGHAATLEVIADSVRNPFTLANFDCPPVMELP